MFTISSKRQAVSYNGFTLIEVVVSVFIFSIIMLSVSQTFIAAFQGYNNTKTVQRDLEAAQFALNLLAKELRTSSIVSPSGTRLFVQFYDHSQGVCFRYRISGTFLQAVQYAPSSLLEPDRQIECAGHSFASGEFTTIASGIRSGVFRAIPSDKDSSPKVMGKVTISLEIGEDASHVARIQTTSSLRDYGYVEL